ncbi:MAG: hypothetical protein U9Q66_00075 [Patescibacteria group bacterium]|nr:hypothetical protein [Patescibacteria group bacterium]
MFQKTLFSYLSEKVVSKSLLTFLIDSIVFEYLSHQINVFKDVV